MARSKRGAFPSCRSVSSSAIPEQPVLSMPSLLPCSTNWAGFVPNQEQPAGANLRAIRRAKSERTVGKRRGCTGAHYNDCSRSQAKLRCCRLVPGLRRLPCMVDFCVYLFYRAALALITALPLRFVFSSERPRFSRLAVLPNYRRLARRNVEIAFGRRKIRCRKRPDRPPPFSTSRRQSPQRDEAQHHAGGEGGGAVAIEGADEVHRAAARGTAGRPRAQPSRQLGVVRASPAAIILATPA